MRYFNEPSVDMLKFPCGICSKTVSQRHKSTHCYICNYRNHIRCDQFDEVTNKTLNKKPGLHMCKKPGLHMCKKPGLHMCKKPGLHMCKKPGLHMCKKPGLHMCKKPGLHMYKKPVKKTWITHV